MVILGLFYAETLPLLLGSILLTASFVALLLVRRYSVRRRKLVSALRKVMEENTFLNIYGLTTNRDIKTIEAFLEQYTDRAANEQRNEEQLMIRRPDSAGQHPEDYEYVPVRTLTEAVGLGLANRRACFSLYLNSKDPNVQKVMLSFTSDDQLILGLSVSSQSEAQYPSRLLTELVDAYGCHLGGIGVEQPPPANEEEFRMQYSQSS